MSWLDDLSHDPIPPLLNSQHPAIIHWTKKSLLHEKTKSTKEELWNLKVPQSILRKQQADGSWIYPSNRAWIKTDYDQLETYRQLGFLIEMFGFTREHPAIEKVADYVFSKQSQLGDFRGIYANQYTPNYTAALLELLIKAGYGNDPRVAKVFDWLESCRQDDGGWALTFRTLGRNLEAINDPQPIKGNKTKPFSHLITGVVLRAYAAHPKYRHSSTAKKAADLLVSRFFAKDVYPDKNHIYDWTRFSFPFWQTDILSSIDIVGQVSPSLANHDKMQQAKQWFIDHQQKDGLFTGHLLKDRYHDLQLWYSFAICRAFKHL